MGTRLTTSAAFLAIFFLALSGAGVTSAAPWAVVANFNDQDITTIHLGSTPPAIYGPFLGGKLGESSVLLDAVVTPDGRYALVSSFYEETVFRIDLTDPTNPVPAGSVELDFGPLDIAIAPNGHFALVTDGGQSVPVPLIAIIDLASLDHVTYDSLTTSDAGAEAVAIAPDNETVIVCDDSNDRIIYGKLDPSTGLESESTLSTGIDSNPNNVAISPDGETALVANFGNDTVSVFRITSPGIVAAGTPPTVGGLPGRQQSIVFSPDGTRAYVNSETPSPDELSWLQINGPGNVSLGGAGVADLLGDGDLGWFGVEVLAVTPDGRHLLAGNPDDDFYGGTPSKDVAMVDLSSWAVTTLATDTDIPVGLSTFTNPLAPTPQPTATPTPNYVELRVAEENPVAGQQLVLEWETYEDRYGYRDVPCLIFLAAVLNPVVEDGAFSVQEVLQGQALFLFDSKLRPTRWTGGRINPTYRGVRFPLGGSVSSGSVPFLVPAVVGGRWVFAVAFIRLDGRGFPSDPPVEVSNGFNLP